jgi:hypothetical protein
MNRDNIFSGDVHGFIIYPAAWAKPHDAPFATVRELAAKRRAALDARNPVSPLQMMLPGAIGASVDPGPFHDPHAVDDAAHRLFHPDHVDFGMIADQNTRRHTGTDMYSPQEHFTHAHGLSAYGNEVEPSITTVFHAPISPLQLEKIAAETGSWAKQHGILAFYPTPDGKEQMLHMRIPTHKPRQQLTPHQIAQSVKPLVNEFNNYFDTTDTGREFWIPGRTIIPHPNGYTDVLALLPPWEKNPERFRQTFQEISQRHGAKQPATAWSGESYSLGGTSPYSDDEREYAKDKERRRIAEQRQNFPMQFDRSPAKTGIVVRGVFYPPGEIIPTLETPGEKTEEKGPSKFQAALEKWKKKKKVTVFPTNPTNIATPDGGVTSTAPGVG